MPVSWLAELAHCPDEAEDPANWVRQAEQEPPDRTASVSSDTAQCGHSKHRADADGDQYQRGNRQAIPGPAERCPYTNQDAPGEDHHRPLQGIDNPDHHERQTTITSQRE